MQNTMRAQKGEHPRSRSTLDLQDAFLLNPLKTCENEGKCSGLLTPDNTLSDSECHRDSMVVCLSAQYHGRVPCDKVTYVSAQHPCRAPGMMVLLPSVDLGSSLFFSCFARYF